jgi:quinol monooxygenase YgiN
MPEEVIGVAVFRPRTGQFDHVRAILESAVAPVHDEPGCVVYALHEGADGSLVFIEKWRSQADLDAHLAADSVAAIMAGVEGRLAGPIEAHNLRALPLGDPFRGSIGRQA